MSKNIEYEKYDKDRKQSVQDELDKIEHARGGYLHLTIAGIEGRTVPIEVTHCPICKKPCPIIIQDQRFICNKCVVIFPNERREKE